MNLITRSLCILALLVFCQAVFAESKLSGFKSAEDMLTLKPGEKLTYAVYWGRLPVGRAVIRVKDVIEMDGKPMYHLTSYAKANKLISLIYPVDDRITSYVEVNGFRPIRFKEILSEGKRKKREEIAFNWETKEATYSKWKNEKQKKRKTIPITEGTQDALSCLYFLRSLALAVGEEYPVKVTTERKCWNVTIKPLKKTKINLRKIGKFDALLIEPIVEFEGLFVHDKKLKIWLDEETKIPLKMVAGIPIGSITLVLCGVEDAKVAAGDKKEEDTPVEDQKDPWKAPKKQGRY